MTDATTRTSSGRDVVVTGLGLVTPAGRGLAESWEGVLAGKSAAAPHEGLLAAGTPVTIACQVPAFDADAELGRGANRRLDRFTHLALLAAREAVQHAGLTGDEDPDRVTGADPDRVGVLLGSGIGGAETWAEEYPRYLDKGPGRVSPMFVPKMLSNTAAGTVAIRTGARGPNLTVNTACAAGASAIHVARDLIRSGSADVVIAGGVEAGITGLSVSAFAQMGALSRNPDAASASRPFDVDRDGFVMGEGAGVLVLESAAHAAARGATVLASVAGAGASADAHHATAPPEDGGGAVLAIQRALEDAGISPSDLGHINAHGTSTPLNDVAESRALRTVLGDALDAIAVSSTKGVTGHLLGAAGAVEAAFAILAMRDGLVPPTANLTRQDPDIVLDVVAGSPRGVALDAVLSTSMGFGGQNAALVLTRA
ncbi:beta-ketoacyl-ACP synthase II [Nitriliruptor alkaliphilus]|uniref:beta-ketoacyl-ACP synthase II n=1 Tax=Nitriliruptor alkaliphilus TaxID=427918 RepID=UPI0006968769|nr:beta-ketoacyl-ACP synthase II [Nitriliruptor alkaliphilus]